MQQSRFPVNHVTDTEDGGGVYQHTSAPEVKLPVSLSCSSASMASSFKTASVLRLLCACAGILSVLSEETNVTAHVGEDIDLHCKVSREDAVITLIQWSRDDLKTKRYVFLFHSNRSHRLYHLPSYRDRVQLKNPELKNGDASVVLTNITTNDSGKYECSVLWDSSGRGRRNEPELTNTVNLLVKPGPAAGNTKEGHTEDRHGEDGHGEDRHTENGNSEDRRGHLGWIAIPVVIVAGLICSVIFRKWRKRPEEPQAIEMG